LGPRSAGNRFAACFLGVAPTGQGGNDLLDGDAGIDTLAATDNQIVQQFLQHGSLAVNGP